MGIGIAAIVASIVIVARYFAATTPPAPLYISHSPLTTVALSPAVSPTLSPSASATPSPAPTPTPKFSMLPVHVPVGWKTFSDTTYNYQISYPPTFYLNGGGIQTNIASVDSSTYQHPGIDQANIGININLYLDITSIATSLTNWGEQVGFVGSATTTVAGETAIRGKTKDDQLPYYSGDVLVIRNGVGYQLSYYPFDSKYESVFEQMLKTFRFTK